MSDAEPIRTDDAIDGLTAITTRHRIVPVVVIESIEHVAGLGDALVDGGLPLAEVTLRTPASLDCLAELAARGDVLTGAGSVRSAEQVDQAVDAGARFVVSPGLSTAVVARARRRGVPALPGVATASEIMQALDLGVTVVKLFPAAQLGGVGAVKALAAPFPGVRFVPTGGVDRSNAGDYLALGAVAAVGGSWMVAPDLLRAGRFDELAERVADAVALAEEVAR